MLQNILMDGISNGTFPGAVAAVGRGDDLLFQTAVGAFSYDKDATPMDISNTIFDLASLTKVLATTTAVALLYQEGRLHLSTTVESILPRFASTEWKEQVTIEHLLTHSAGFPPDPSPWFWEESFGCPPKPQSGGALLEAFSCLPRIYDTVLAQPLGTAPGTAFLYSDLSFMTLQFVVGKIALDHEGERDVDGSYGSSRSTAGMILRCRKALQNNTSFGYARRPGETDETLEGVWLTCAFERFVRERVLRHLSGSGSIQGSSGRSERYPHGMESAKVAGPTFLLPEHLWSFAAPTLNDTEYTHRQPIQGQVSDGDAFAMGGIAGHAGIFSTIDGVASFAQAMLRWRRESATPFDEASQRRRGDLDAQGLLNSTTANTFTTVRNLSFSSRALGWDTNLHEVDDFGFGGVCGGSTSTLGHKRMRSDRNSWAISAATSQYFSEETFLHIGYTGTCICIDPQSSIWTVVLTNRVYGCQGQTCSAGSEDDVKQIYREFNEASAELFM